MHKKGRPTRYRKRFCKMLVDFYDVEPYQLLTLKTRTIKKKNGEIIVDEEKKPIANPLPFVYEFCDLIKISPTTFHNWLKVHPDFVAAFTRAQEMQKKNLITLGLAGISPPASFIYVASNLTDMRPAGVGDLPERNVIVPIIVQRGEDRPALPEAKPEMIAVSIPTAEYAEKS